MASPTINIDDVVREVLAQLGLTPAPAAAAPEPAKQPPSVPAPPPASPPSPPTKDQLVVTGRVVTLAEIGERLAGIRQLVAPAGSIVTPAVRDELRRRNITLVFGPKTNHPSAGGVRLVLMAAGPVDVAALAGLLEADGLAIESRHSDCLIAAVDEAAAELAKGATLAVLATAHPAAALCLANRLGGVRAVLGNDARTVAAETASVGANLLVVHPAGLGSFQLKQLVVRFCQEPAHDCPQVFSQRLG